MARPLPMGCQSWEMIYDGCFECACALTALQRGPEGPACCSGHGPGACRPKPSWAVAEGGRDWGLRRGLVTPPPPPVTVSSNAPLGAREHVYPPWHREGPGTGGRGRLSSGAGASHSESPQGAGSKGPRPARPVAGPPAASSLFRQNTGGAPGSAASPWAPCESSVGGRAGTGPEGDGG